MFRQNRRDMQMQIKKVDPTFRIDRSQTSWAINQQSFFQLMRRFQSQSLQKSLEAIGQIASEGDRLRMIHQKHQTMANIFSDRLTQAGQLNMVAVPRAEMSWNPGEFEIEWTPFEHELIWDMPGIVDFQVQPHQVTIKLEQLPDVKFRFVYIDQPQQEAATSKSGKG